MSQGPWNPPPKADWGAAQPARAPSAVVEFFLGLLISMAMLLMVAFAGGYALFVFNTALNHLPSNLILPLLLFLFVGLPLGLTLFFGAKRRQKLTPGYGVGAVVGGVVMPFLACVGVVLLIVNTCKW